MRNNKALGLQFLVLAVLAFTVFSALLIATHEQRSMTTGWLGIVLFRSLGVVQGLLLALLAPAFAAGAFTLEREQQTFESLMLSPIGAGALVRGKLVAAILFPTLLMTLALPMLALTLLYGGVGPQDLVGTYVVQLLNGLFLGCLALGWSMVCRSTSSAVVATYLTVAAYLFGTLLLGAMAMDEPFAVGALSPAMAPFVASETVPLCGRPVPLWIPSAALLLYGTAWCLDVCVMRAKEMRHERGSGRPRVWALVFCLLGGAVVAESVSVVGYFDAGEAAAQLMVVVCLVGSLGVLVFGTVEAPPDRPWRGWWRVLSPRTGSAPLFLTLVPWAALLGYWLAKPVLHSGAPSAAEWEATAALTVSVSSSLFAAAWVMVWLQGRLPARWPALFVGLILLLLAHATYAELVYLLVVDTHEWLIAMVPALSPYTVLLSIADDVPSGWIWEAVVLGLCGQFVILLLLWLARATPPRLKPATGAGRGSPAGSSRG